MKGSIYSRIRTHTLVMVSVTALLFIAAITYGMYGGRDTFLRASGELGGTAAAEARNMLIKHSKDELAGIVQSKAAFIDELLSVIENNVEHLAYAVTVALTDPRFTETELMEMLSTVMLENFRDGIAEDGVHVAVYYGTESGEFYIRDTVTDNTPTQDVTDRPWYTAAKEAGRLIWSDVYQDNEGRGLSITCAMPYYWPDGRMAGVAGIGILINRLAETVSDINTGYTEESVESFIVNERGEIIIADSIETDANGDFSRESLFDDPDESMRETARLMTGGDSGIREVIRRGVPMMIAYSPLEIMPWSFAVCIETNAVTKPADDIENMISEHTTAAVNNVDTLIMYGAVIVTVLLIIIIAVVIYVSDRASYSILLPIKKLTEDAEIIGSGNLDHTLTVNTGDELEALTSAFNSMIRNVKSIAADKERIERQSAEKEREAAIIQEAHAQLQSILDMLPVGVRIMSLTDGSLLYANKASMEVFGCLDMEGHIIEHTGYEFMPEYQPEGMKTTELIEEISKSEKCIVELQCLKLNGEPFTARFSNANINYQGIRASLAIVQDMTAEKEYRQMLENAAQREREANQLKSRFLATMSHEIRTPMNAILGIAEIQLRGRNLSEETAEAIGRIYESGNLLLGIINDILDLSKIEADRLEISPVDYDILSLINDVVQLYRLRYENKPIEFKINVKEGIPIYLHGDEIRIKQIVGNILSNAYKYTDSGSVELDVSYEYYKGTGEDTVVLVFKISDTGQGMTEEQISVVFNEYTRFNIEANREIVGAGLGMYITKRLIDLMGGEITVDSAVGEGTVFTARIPQKRIGGGEYDSSMQDKLWDMRYKTAGRMLKDESECEYMPYGSVLIVDDVITNLYVAEGMMQPYGLKIDLAESGFEAVDKIKDGNVYDIIFMDHMMPKMDGVKATQIIRETGYTNCIIALTANAIVGESEMYLENGFDEFVSKPIDSRELDAILIKYIRDRHTKGQ